MRPFECSDVTCSSFIHRVCLDRANSYRLINIFLGVFAVLSIVQYIRYPMAGRVIGALLTTIITWGVVQYIRRQPSDRAYLLLADGVMVLYALAVILV